MKGIITSLAVIPLLALSGCNLTPEEKEKLDNAAADLEKLADQIIITSPAKDSVVDQSIVTVRADIPADAQAQEVALFVDGIEIAKDTDGAPWEIQWPAYYYADGKKHTLLLKTTTGSGNEVRNNEHFQLTVAESANQALVFSGGVDGTHIQDSNQLEVAFAAFPGATRYEVTDGTQTVESTTTAATLNDLDVGSYAIRYRAIFDYSTSTVLTGPWSAPAQVEVLPPALPKINPPQIVKNELGYEVKFSWDPISEDDSYSISLTKSGETAEQIIPSNAHDELVLPGMEMGTYTWSLIRTTALGQSASSESQDLGVGVFKRQFGGSADDYARHVIASHDGGFIILASTKSKGDAQGDDWFIKLDSNGDLEWEYVLNKTGSSRLYDLREFSDGSIYAYGSNGNWQDAKGYLIKLSGETNAQDRLLWEIEYRHADAEKENFRSFTENASRLFVASDERECVTEGGSTSCIISKSKLVEFHVSTGEYVSSFELPGLSDGSVLDGLGYLTTVSDGDFLLACSAKEQNADEYFFGGACLMKFDITGQLDWSHSYVDAATFLNGRFGAETPWGEYVLLGQTFMGDDSALARISSTGSKIGTYTAGVDTYSNQRETVVFDDDENILMLLSGRYTDRPELWSTSKNGFSQKLKVFEELKRDYSYPQSLDRAGDGLILLFNEDQSGYNNSDIIVLKTDLTGNM